MYKRGVPWNPWNPSGSANALDSVGDDRAEGDPAFKQGLS